MNIIDAVKSGKRFKRKNGLAWFFANEVYSYTADDILADDWELEEPTIRITRTEYYNAYKTAECEAKESGFHHADVLAKWLGL